MNLEEHLELVPKHEAQTDGEFSSLSLGDARLDRRLDRCLGKLISNPGKSLPEQAGNWPEAKAFYRLLGQEALDAQSLLAAHAQSALARARGNPEEVYLAVQDTTTLNFSARHQLEGLGNIGNDKGLGLFAHGTLLMGAGSGKIHGLLDSKLYARDESKSTKSRPGGARNREPIEEKESYRWLESFECSLTAQEGLPGAQVVNVADREADIYELLLLAQSHRDKGLGLLIRSKHNRGQCGREERIWESLGSVPERGRLKVVLPSSRGLQIRHAELSVRFEQVELSIPKDKLKYTDIVETVKATVLEVRSTDEQNPILWRLLTTREVINFAGACELVRWYCARWQIEVFHRVLKTGCRVERRQMREMKRLRTMIALDMIVAVHLLAIIARSRAEPEAHASVCFDKEQINVVCTYLPDKSVRPEELTIETAVMRIAKLGGFLARKNDGKPGAEVLWRGIQKINTIVQLARDMQMTYG